jgi:hypothetical protein
MIRFACPQCHKGFQTDDKAAGKKTKCPKCGGAITVPAPEQPATADPIPQLTAATPAATAGADDGYALASEPATRKPDDFWDSLDPPSEHLVPMPARIVPVRTQISRPAQRSRANGPSMALVAVGGLFLIGITVGATLWATGSFSRAPASKPPEVSEKTGDANAERLAELNRREAEKTAQVQKQAEEAARAEQLRKQAEEDRRKREEYERTERERRVERDRSLKAELNEASEERDSLKKKYDALVVKKNEALRSAAWWTQHTVDSIRAGFSKDVVDGAEQNMKQYQTEAKNYESQLEGVKDSIERVGRKIRRIEQELGATKE